MKYIAYKFNIDGSRISFIRTTLFDGESTQDNFNRTLVKLTNTYNCKVDLKYNYSSHD